MKKIVIVAGFLAIGPQAHSQGELGGWQFGGSVGVAISSVVTPEFRIIDTEEGKRVVRAHTLEDDSDVRLVPFAHFHSDGYGDKLRTPRLGSLGVSLGVGELTNDSVNIFVGVGWHLGHQAYLSFGGNWRTVPTLPAGQWLDMEPMRDGILNDLPTRTEGGVFLSFTYAVHDKAREAKAVLQEAGLEEDKIQPLF